MASWCRNEVQKSQRKPLIQNALQLVQASVSAPIANELLMRYQTSIDNELYRAIGVLRKEQEWRSKNLVTLDVE